MPRVSRDLRSLLSDGIGGRRSDVDNTPWTIDKVVAPNDDVHEMEVDDSDDNSTNDSLDDTIDSVPECATRFPRGNRLMDVGCLASFLCDFVICKNCCKGSFVVVEECTGLATKLMLSCTHCTTTHCIESKRSVTKKLKVNCVSMT
jgi:hypothetical protein